MKNFMKVCALVLVLVLVSGCGSKGKVLTCTMTEKESGMKMTNTAKFTFEKDKATKLNLNMKVVLDDSMKSYAKLMATSLESQFSGLKEKKGIKFTSNTKGNTVTLVIDADLTKMDKDAKKELDIDGTEGSMKDAKKAMEKAGFKCK